MIVPGRMNFYGSTFIGRPILTSGWNEHLGWSHTVNAPDLEEIYEVDLDPAHPDHYLFDGGSVPLERDDVTVAANAAATIRVLQTRTFWHTPLGPVVHRTADKGLHPAQRELRQLSSLRAMAADDADQEPRRVSRGRGA